MKPTHLRLRRACAAAAAAGVLLAPALTASAYAAAAPSPSPSSPSPAPDFVQLTPAVAAQLDAAVRQVMRKTQVPGVTVGLWAPGKGATSRRSVWRTRRPAHP